MRRSILVGIACFVIQFAVTDTSSQETQRSTHSLTRLPQSLSTARKTHTPIVTRRSAREVLHRLLQIASTTRERPLIIGVMGSSADEATIPRELKTRLEQLGTEIARRGHAVLTGSTVGMPNLVARAAHRYGGITLGVSPAKTMREHRALGLVVDNLDLVQLTGTGSGIGFIAQERANIGNSDLLIFVGGRSGTLGELLFAMQTSTVVGFLRDSTGVAEAAEALILPHLEAPRGTIVGDRDPQKLLDKVLSSYQTRAQTRSHSRDPSYRHSTLDQLSSQKSQPFSYGIVGNDALLTPQERSALKNETEHLLMALKGYLGSTTTPTLHMAARMGWNESVSHQAKELGFRVEAFSPARNKQEHRRISWANPAQFDRVTYLSLGVGLGEIAMYQHLVEQVPILFVLSGDSHALGAIVFALYRPMVIAILETHGVAKALRTEILSTFNKPSEATIVYDTDPKRLVEKAHKATVQKR